MVAAPPDAPLERLPMLAQERRPARDLARGLAGYGLWALPIGELVAASALGGASVISRFQEGVLLLAGTLAFGGLCLSNAVRCNRTHCWIDGTLLPVLAAAGAVQLAGLVEFGWGLYVQVLWGIVGLSFLVECGVGSYLGRGRPTG